YDQRDTQTSRDDSGDPAPDGMVEVDVNHVVERRSTEQSWQDCQEPGDVEHETGQADGKVDAGAVNLRPRERPPAPGTARDVAGQDLLLHTGRVEPARQRPRLHLQAAHGIVRHWPETRAEVMRRNPKHSHAAAIPTFRPVHAIAQLSTPCPRIRPPSA